MNMHYVNEIAVEKSIDHVIYVRAICGLSGVFNSSPVE